MFGNEGFFIPFGSSRGSDQGWGLVRIVCLAFVCICLALARYYAVIQAASSAGNGGVDPGSARWAQNYPRPEPSQQLVPIIVC